MSKEEWFCAAKIAFRRYLATCKKQGKKRFTFEQFRFYALENSLLELPKHHNHWGALGSWAAHEELVRFTGKFSAATSPATHRHPVRVLEVV